MTDKYAKYIKAFVAVAACIGVIISPEQQETIIAGFLAVYAIVSGKQGKDMK